MEFGNVPKDKLNQVVEKIERLEAQRESIKEDIKEVYKEASGMGFDPKIIRQLISRRKKDQEKLRQEEETLDLYMHAIGMAETEEA